MMSLTEARQRLAMSGMKISKRDREFRVAYAELAYRDAEPSAYYTDDLEDAVITGSRMRATMPLDVTVRRAHGFA
ncbi:hypothetical protein [Bradyrhizobium sp. th.b2]|uniref:hypothetical protein n=1 Tax=Bradyrhizobium sp. th-b2 TaxID=172088 RepID=UPI00041C7AFD|nr:hypothetical protein [Bradyrhizobium sp. th.b2]